MWEKIVIYLLHSSTDLTLVTQGDTSLIVEVRGVVGFGSSQDFVESLGGDGCGATMQGVEEIWCIEGDKADGVHFGNCPHHKSRGQALSKALTDHGAQVQLVSFLFVLFGFFSPLSWTDHGFDSRMEGALILLGDSGDVHLIFGLLAIFLNIMSHWLDFQLEH